MKDSDLKIRTKQYTLAIILLYSELPKRTELQIIGRLIVQSAVGGIVESSAEKAYDFGE